MLRMFRKLFSDVDKDNTANASPINLNNITSETSIQLPLTDELLLHILSFVPADDLLNNCIWVKEWQYIIGSQSLWLLKCKRENKPLPAIRPDPLPDHFYRCIYFVPYGKNLILNPCGQNGLQDWKICKQTDYYESAWAIENPPAGIDPCITKDNPSGHCFVTSYFWDTKTQSVDLLKAVGEFPQILDSLRPSIEVSEWIGTRFDCGSMYKLEVKLETENGELLDDFLYEHEERVMLGQWTKVTHVFSKYPAGVRYLHFTHSGKDTQFWAGLYGCKMTEAHVGFVLTEETPK